MIVDIVDSSLVLRPDKRYEAVNVLKALAEKDSGKDITPTKHCSSCQCSESQDEIVGAATLVLTGARWGLDSSGTLEPPRNIMFGSHELERKFWHTLAKWLQDHSFIEIEYRNTIDEKYRLFFWKGAAYIQNQITSWPDSVEGEGSEPLEPVPPDAEE